ncbi:ribose-phosphate pyrophosphokinase [archaeon]|nr:MAG: ribose-phosphate pyrophosphokinase [archaeon]
MLSVSAFSFKAVCQEENDEGTRKRRKAAQWKGSSSFEEPKVAHQTDISIISGSTNKTLSDKISQILGKRLSLVDIKKFSDGEIMVSIDESMRGKDVFVIQTCSPPVNDNVMELFLTVAAAKRAGATSVTAVIPYFGYKLNRRGLPINTTHHTRFLWNAAGDIAKMLQVIGADKVISVDLQRPGQGHEACFFPHSQLVAETISTNDIFVEFFAKLLQGNTTGPLNLSVVSPNTEYTKKARKFQKKLRTILPSDCTVDRAVFLRSDAETVKGAQLEIQGDVRNKDVILIEDYIDSTVHLTILANKLLRDGARRVFICASHGYFDEHGVRLLELSPISKVVISDSIEMPKQKSEKIVQLSIAPLLAAVIESDIAFTPQSEFNNQEDEDYVVE